jgi:hypothetical protein
MGSRKSESKASEYVELAAEAGTNIAVADLV